jgi:hypothetical protein
MTGIRASTDRYEAWLLDRLGEEVVRADLNRKHDKMRASPFSFLRATYWRWAETAGSVLPDLLDAPPILSIGDTHLENFGTWRDVEGRLVWGANDFDDAAVMPYPLDLVRLAASATLDRGRDEMDPVCEAIWSGYADGLDCPAPVILERNHRSLRKAIMLPEKDRAKFWGKFCRPDEQVRPRYRHALTAAMPEPGPIRAFPRSAGTGSLGRPRIVGVAEWRGGPVVRECKPVLPSAWSVFADGQDGPILAAEIAAGRYRAVDPHYQVAGGLIVRRLSPNSRKIEVGEADDLLVSPDMLKRMGREIATCHAGDAGRLDEVRRHAEAKRWSWLRDPVLRAVAAVRADFKAFA